MLEWSDKYLRSRSRTGAADPRNGRLLDPASMSRDKTARFLTMLQRVRNRVYTPSRSLPRRDSIHRSNLEAIFVAARAARGSGGSKRTPTDRRAGGLGRAGIAEKKNRNGKKEGIRA